MPPDLILIAERPAIEAPPDEAAVIDLVRDAAASREPLAVEGRGTKRGMLRPVQAARTLSTRALTGITLHAPQELIVSARAGTTLPELEAILATGGQGLISEPPDLSALLGAEGPATIGGSSPPTSPAPAASPGAPPATTSWASAPSTAPPNSSAPAAAS